LGAAGLFDEQKAIDLVASHAFAFVVIDRAMFGEQFYSPTMMAALQAYYPVSRRIAGHQVMLPAGT
jgi:hypothetical protein